MPRHPPEEKLAILERRKRVAALYLRGLTQWEIARQEDVDQKTVSRDLVAIQSQWLATSVAAVDARKAQELAKLDALERTYQDAWDRSCKPREIKHAKNREGTRPHKEAAMRTEQRDGNPHFLAGVGKCIELRLKIFGLLKERHEHSGIDGAPIETVEIVRLPAKEGDVSAH